MKLNEAEAMERVDDAPEVQESALTLSEAIAPERLDAAINSWVCKPDQLVKDVDLACRAELRSETRKRVRALFAKPSKG